MKIIFFVKAFCIKLTPSNTKEDADYVKREDIVVCLPSSFSGHGTKRLVLMTTFPISRIDHHTSRTKHGRQAFFINSKLFDSNAKLETNVIRVYDIFSYHHYEFICFILFFPFSIQVRRNRKTNKYLGTSRNVFKFFLENFIYSLTHGQNK